MKTVCHIRPLEPRDRLHIEEIVVSSGKFNDEEIRTSIELVDEALQKGEASGYIIEVLEEEKTPPIVPGICLLWADSFDRRSV